MRHSAVSEGALCEGSRLPQLVSGGEPRIIRKVMDIGGATWGQGGICGGGVAKAQAVTMGVSQLKKGDIL